MMRKPFLLLVVLMLVPLVSQAEDATLIGPRVGFTMDPDQFTFGGQIETEPFATDLTFVPSVELGFGDNWTVVALNADLHYHFTIRDSRWRPYVGGGLGVNFLHFEQDTPFFTIEGDETEVGGNLLVGVTTPTRSGSHFFTEIRLGLGDIPDAKFMVGWNFRL